LDVVKTISDDQQDKITHVQQMAQNQLPYLICENIT